MRIKRILEFDPRVPLSEEQRVQARKGMEKIDITESVSVLPASTGNDATTSSEEVASAKRFMEKVSRLALKENGIKRRMSNFSEDYPVNVLVRADCSVISEVATEILSCNLGAQLCRDVFFALFGEEYDQKLADFAEKKGKTIEELTDEEQRRVAHNFTVQIGANAFSEILRAQSVKEIYEIAKDTRVPEDFCRVSSYANFDSINFYHSERHDRAKYGKTVNVENVNEAVANECIANPEIRSVEGDSIIKGFCELLSEEERNILRLKEEGYRETEIANLLNYRSQGSISKKVKKIKKKLKEYLK